jgi:hypothetical protein
VIPRGRRSVSSDVSRHTLFTCIVRALHSSDRRGTYLLRFCEAWMRSANWNSGLVTLRSPPSTVTPMFEPLTRLKLLVPGPAEVVVPGDACPVPVGLRGGLCVFREERRLVTRPAYTRQQISRRRECLFAVSMVRETLELEAEPLLERHCAQIHTTTRSLHATATSEERGREGGGVVPDLGAGAAG